MVINHLKIPIMYLLLLLSWSELALGVRNQFEHFEKCPLFSQGACKDVVEKYDYPCEEHTVVTEDGFILGIQRIPKGRKRSNVNYVNNPKPPILLQHGVFMDGVSFMLIEEESLAFYLADNGFDVWVANTRGTTYSRKHTHLNPFQKEYWNWSVDELVKYDFTATLDYVHDRTKQNVHYLGHSMGGMIALIGMASDLPCVKQMRSTSLISPLAYMNHIISPFSNIAAHLRFAENSESIGILEFNPIGSPAAEIYNLICAHPGVDCSKFLLGITGPNCCLNDTGINNFLAHGAQSTSTKVLMQLAQNIRGEGLKMYDHGSEKENKKQYGSVHPPGYDMNKTPNNMPMFFSSGAVDFMADFLDVQFLLLNFWHHDNSRIIKNFHFDYAHADFLIATNAVDRVYKPLVSFLKSN